MENRLAVAKGSAGKDCCLSCLTVWDPMDVVRQAPLSLGFSRQEYWSGQPFRSPGEPPDPGIKPRFPALQADSLPSEPQGKPLVEGAGD